MSNTALETLHLLERRLARLEFYLESDDTSTGTATGAQEPITWRLANLEQRFANICSKYPAAKELLQLQERLPEISSETRTDEFNPTPSSANQLQIVLSSAPSYPAIASGLNALQEYPVPDPKPFASLLALSSSLFKAQTTQEKQTRHVEELRQRSASLLAKWYQSKILEGGEQWSDWEDRLCKAEQTLRRAETAAVKERNEV